MPVTPALVASAGLPVPGNADGRSFLAFCNGEVPSGWRDEAHWSYDFRNIISKRFETAFSLPSDRCNLQVVRPTTLKYVHFAGMPPVLFDLSDDPGEMVNRATDPACRSLLNEGLDRLLTWRMCHEDESLARFMAKDGVLHSDS
ncbi:hypothetical protein C8J35_109217 [Rhizobium sp. PP-F2F-G38]|nr:hypothetical protein C8J35_109217 [Rhizobium sp. PP-F2F-G38]